MDRLLPALTDDARDRVYRYFWLPMLALQLLLYSRVVIRFLAQPAYSSARAPELPLLRENHIGNLVSLKAQPSLPLLSIHVAMAWSWILVVILQKHLVSRMARAAGEASFGRYRAVHAAVGTFMVVLGIVGIGVAPVIALMDHGNPPMKWFLLGQPLFFLPAMVMVIVTARDARRSIRHHRFWADTAFLGPAVASIWTEGAIYALGRWTPLGPNMGEFVASAAGGALGALAVVGPAWLSRKRGLAAEQGR